MCNQIWLNHLMDDRHLSYITKIGNWKKNPDSFRRWKDPTLVRGYDLGLQTEILNRLTPQQVTSVSHDTWIPSHCQVYKTPSFSTFLRFFDLPSVFDPPPPPPPSPLSREMRVRLVCKSGWWRWRASDAQVRFQCDSNKKKKAKTHPLFLVFFHEWISSIVAVFFFFFRCLSCRRWENLARV